MSNGKEGAQLTELGFFHERFKSSSQKRVARNYSNTTSSISSVSQQFSALFWLNFKTPFCSSQISNEQKQMSMDEQTHMLLEHYRRDRQKLLQFLISSSNLIKQVRSSSGSTSSLSDINLDTLSADYVISCINSGEALA